MDAMDKGQVNQSAAEVYEEFFVPALFQEWAVRVVDAAQIQPGQRILDVACGTGIVARTAAERGGSVTGLDINDGMLTVARQKNTLIDWRQGRAEALPFDNHLFDAVVSQFGLMFFEDRTAAIREMMRVLKPGGRLVIAVWAALADTPGYAALADLLQRLFGDRAADGIRVPYVLGDPQNLQAIFAEAGLSGVQITTDNGTARFPSIDAWVYTDIKGWVLADILDDDQLALLLKEAQQTLKPFVNTEGMISFRSPAHIVTAIKS